MVAFMIACQNPEKDCRFHFGRACKLKKIDLKICPYGRKIVEQCALCENMIKIFYGSTQSDRNYIAGLIQNAVFKFGCKEDVLQECPGEIQQNFEDQWRDRSGHIYSCTQKHDRP